MTSIDITPAARSELLALLQQFLPGVTVWAFGSRVKWTARSNSDLDLVVFSRPEEEAKVSLLKEALEESALPFRVDLLVWDNIPESFQKNIQACYAVLIAEKAMMSLSTKSNDESKGQDITLEWKTVKLGDVSTIRRGSSPRPIINYMAPEGMPWVKISDATESSSRYINKTNEFIRHEGVGRSVIVNKGDLILSNSGTAGLPKFMGITACIHDGWQVFSDLIGIDKEFLYYTLLNIRSRLLHNAYDSTMKNLTLDMVRDAQIKLPTIEKQKKIAGVLSSIDGKIEINQNINQTLEQMAQAIFKSWFVDFDPVKAKMAALAAGGSEEDAVLAAMQAISGKNAAELLKQQAEQPEQYAELRATAELFPSAMQDSELGEIPEGWEVKQLSEICKVVNGRAYKNTEFKTEGTPIVRIQNLSNGGKTVYSDLELSPDKYIEGEDFIYAWSATFGPHIWRGPKSIYHYHIWKMEVDEFVVSRYFLYLSMFRKTEAMKNAGTGSIFTHLTKQIMESQLILVGNQSVNKKFSELVVPIFEQISSLNRGAGNLADIRDTLLPKLLSGELPVMDV